MKRLLSFLFLAQALLTLQAIDILVPWITNETSLIYEVRKGKGKGSALLKPWAAQQGIFIWLHGADINWHFDIIAVRHKDGEFKDLYVDHLIKAKKISSEAYINDMINQKVRVSLVEEKRQMQEKQNVTLAQRRSELTAGKEEREGHIAQLKNQQRDIINNIDLQKYKISEVSRGTTESIIKNLERQVKTIDRDIIDLNRKISPLSQGFGLRESYVDTRTTKEMEREAIQGEMELFVKIKKLFEDIDVKDNEIRNFISSSENSIQKYINESNSQIYKKQDEIDMWNRILFSGGERHEHDTLEKWVNAQRQWGPKHIVVVKGDYNHIGCWRAGLAVYWTLTLPANYRLADERQDYRTVCCWLRSPGGAFSIIIKSDNAYIAKADDFSGTNIFTNQKEYYNPGPGSSEVDGVSSNFNLPAKINEVKGLSGN